MRALTDGEEGRGIGDMEQRKKWERKLTSKV